jgi:hypothetical protein
VPLGEMATPSIRTECPPKMISFLPFVPSQMMTVQSSFGKVIRRRTSDKIPDADLARKLAIHVVEDC